jgi:hypothetical protein
VLAALLGTPRAHRIVDDGQAIEAPPFAPAMPLAPEFDLQERQREIERISRQHEQQFRKLEQELNRDRAAP